MTPTIACVFHQTVPLGVDPAALLVALQEYVDKHLGPVWSVGCKLRLSDVVGPGEWMLVWADDADQAGALGYHNDPLGRPVGYVFVRTSQRAGEPISVTASHELAEMLIDPGANLGAFTPRGRWAALEICDPVESETFAINGLPVSDFVYPPWFGEPGQVYDHLGHLSKPWQLLRGGYIPVWQSGGWTQIFGSFAKAAAFREEDRQLRRGSRRKSLGALAPAAITEDAQDVCV